MLGCQRYSHGIAVNQNCSDLCRSRGIFGPGRDILTLSSVCQKKSTSLIQCALVMDLMSSSKHCLAKPLPVDCRCEFVGLLQAGKDCIDLWSDVEKIRWCSSNPEEKLAIHVARTHWFIQIWLNLALCEMLLIILQLARVLFPKAWPVNHTCWSGDTFLAFE